MILSQRIVCLLIISLSIFVEHTVCSYYDHAVVESCSGCSLNRLPDVKKFIFQDVPDYDRVEFKHIQGAPPELVLYDNNNEERERLPLSKSTREECNDLLVAKGFTRVNNIKDEI